jgi:thiol reductant ABC exporter CydC subunit
MNEVVRVLRLSRPAFGRLGLSVLAGSGAAGCGIGLMAASAWLIARAAQHPPVLYLTMAIVAVRAFGIGRAVLRYLERLAGHDAAFRVLAGVRAGAYDGLRRSAPAGRRRLRSGDLVSRFVTDVDAAMDVLTRVVTPYLVAVLTGAAAAAFLAVLLPAAGAVLLVGLAAVAVAVPMVHSRLSRRADERTAPLRGELAAQVVELVHGAPDLLMHRAAARRAAEVERTDDRLRRVAARSAAGVGIGAGLAGLAAGASVWFSLLLGSTAVRAGTLDGVLLAVVVLTPVAAFDLVAPLPTAAAQLNGARSALRRVFSIVDAPAAVPDPIDPAPLPDPPFHLRLEAVTARWDDAGPDAVRDLTLDLPAGRRVALVGPTGCGKTTVAALLVRFLDPVDGRVTLNGTDLRELCGDDVRRVVGLVAEDAHVFDTTIEENLRIGRADATVDQMRGALAAVRLLDAVDRLPDGLQTRVGERGVRLSGGQRRRLTLARALLADSPVLILDEPTEHLDDAAATAIMDDILAATSGRTVLLISHRPYGLEAMDEIVRLAPGLARSACGLGALPSRQLSPACADHEPERHAAVS